MLDERTVLCSELHQLGHLRQEGCSPTDANFLSFVAQADLSGLRLDRAIGLRPDEIMALMRLYAISTRNFVSLLADVCTNSNITRCAQPWDHAAKMTISVLPEPAFPDLESMLSRKFGREIANYFSGNRAQRGASPLYFHLTRCRLSFKPCLLSPH